jgi:hypothetical protein
MASFFLSVRSGLSRTRSNGHTSSTLIAAPDAVRVQIPEEPQFDLPCEIDAMGRRSSARIIGHERGLLLISTPFWLTVTCRVWLHFHGKETLAQIQSCTPSNNGHILGAKIVDLRTRRESRTPTDIPGSLILCGQVSEIPVQIVDVSNSGLGLTVHCEVASYIGVAIKMPGGFTFGVTRYCRKEKDFFRVGVEKCLMLAAFERNSDGSNSPSPVQSN